MNLITTVGLTILFSHNALASTAKVTCDEQGEKLTLSFDLDQSQFKYEYLKGANLYSFESKPVNDWAKQHTTVSSSIDGDIVDLNAQIASGDSFPECIPVPGTRQCSGYEPSVGLETIAEVELEKSGNGSYLIKDISVFHYGGYELQKFIGKECQLIWAEGHSKLSTNSNFLSTYHVSVTDSAQCKVLPLWTESER